jgi:RNA 2',3'-cyclic 3'-phosphodiesterase
LESLLGEIERILPDAAPALRWIPVANIHLTLHFLGNLDAARQVAVRSQLADPLATAPFDLSLGDLGTFPPSGPPRILWIAVRDGRQELAAIHGELGMRLRASGVTIEDRPFSPHFTLARVRDAERRRVRRLPAELGRVPVSRVQWHVRDVALYFSDLSGPAPRYDAVQRIALRLE